jgi:hypothetical protein
MQALTGPTQAAWSVPGKSDGVLERLPLALDAEIEDFFDATRVARGPFKPLPSGRRKQI